MTRASPTNAARGLPATEHTLLLRTDFADDAAWDALRAAIEAPIGDFRAYVTALSDRAFDGETIDRIVELAAPGERSFVFVADAAALADPEHAILVIDLDEQPGRSFRVVPTEAWSVENNLSIANMDFEEFAAAVDDAGVFRGFRDE